MNRELLITLTREQGTPVYISPIHIISIERNRNDIITDILVTSGHTLSVTERPVEILRQIEEVL
jgi:uncharacterized protein YlzI (FlbEa/FlbD family)